MGPSAHATSRRSRAASRGFRLAIAASHSRVPASTFRSPHRIARLTSRCPKSSMDSRMKSRTSSIWCASVPPPAVPIARLSVNGEQDEAPRPGPDAKADALDLALDVRVFAEPDGGGAREGPSQTPTTPRLATPGTCGGARGAGCGGDARSPVLQIGRPVWHLPRLHPARGCAGTCQGACIGLQRAYGRQTSCSPDDIGPRLELTCAPLSAPLWRRGA